MPSVFEALLAERKNSIVARLHRSNSLSHLRIVILLYHQERLYKFIQSWSGITTWPLA